MERRIKVLTLGTFDIPHAGHAAFLKRCSEFGDVVVGVNTDEFVKYYKKQAPIFNFVERYSLISAMGYEVAANDSEGKDTISEVAPDVIAIGSDWARRDYYTQIDVTQDWLDEHNISMLYIPYTKGISTTEIKNRVKD